MSDKTYLDRDDYEEPRCLLCMDANGRDDKPVSRIDAGRMLARLDEYFSHNDYEGAERHLKFWLTEAQFGNDKEGELLIRNEMMGLFRKLSKKDEAYEALNNALSLLDVLSLDGTEIYGTTHLNAATVLKAFGEPEKSIDLFRKAEEAYAKRLDASDTKFAGLYNNMGLTLTDLGRYGEALDCYRKAVKIMSAAENGELDEAITYLNLANLYEARDGLEKAAEEINSALEKAENLLNTPSLDRNGYYAFVCEKCAPTFLYYGWFAFSEELNERAREIYERT
ncbi:MAG: tetratricopeptide repeat protein [Ruminococcaceae bacterium]|nr:tetratricopeptide repeat protein [Oscillospiraceae bacterium]